MHSLVFKRSSAWAIWTVVSFFYAYQYILRVIPNIMIDEMMQQFHINSSTFGQFSGVYYIGYALMHLPIGMLFDRFGPKKVMPICILLSVAGLIPLIFSDAWIHSVIGRFLTGVGSSGAILGLFKIIRMLFDAKQFPRMLSFSVAIGLIGAIYGGGPISYMLTEFGYRFVIKFLLLVGIGLAAAAYWIIPISNSTLEKNTFFSNIRETFLNKNVLFICFCAGLMVGPLEGFADVWGSIFLRKIYGLENLVSSSLTSLIFLGMCFGGPIISYISEKIGNPFITISGAGFIMAMCFYLLLLKSISAIYLPFLFIILGICCAYQILAIYAASTFVKEETAGLTTATANMIIMIFGYAFHSLIGKLISYFETCNPKIAISYGISIIPIALCLGSFGFFTLTFLKKDEKIVN